METEKMYFIDWVRWFLVLPAAIGAFFGVQIVIAIGNSIGTSGVPFIDEFCQLVNSLAGPFCFVFVGAKVAPKYNFISAIVLAIIGVILYTFGFIIIWGSPIGEDTGKMIWLVIASILTIIGIVSACVYFHNDELNRISESK